MYIIKRSPRNRSNPTFRLFRAHKPFELRTRDALVFYAYTVVNNRCIVFAATVRPAIRDDGNTTSESIENVLRSNSQYGFFFFLFFGFFSVHDNNIIIYIVLLLFIVVARCKRPAYKFT